MGTSGCPVEDLQIVVALHLQPAALGSFLEEYDTGTLRRPTNVETKAQKPTDIVLYTQHASRKKIAPQFCHCPTTGEGPSSAHSACHRRSGLSSPAGIMTARVHSNVDGNAATRVVPPPEIRV